MELTLSPEEQHLLEDILDERYLILQREIGRTDHREFRKTLRNNEKLIESMLNRLRTGIAARAS